MRGPTISVVVIAAAVAIGCAKAPEATEVAREATKLKLEGLAFEARLPVGAKQRDDYGTSISYEIPGRGGAFVRFAFESGVGDLAERTRNASEQRGADGGSAKVVRSEVTSEGRAHIVSVAENGKFVRVSVAIPLPTPTSGRAAMSCWAAVTHAEPIADVEGTRQALETVCDSVAFAP